MSTQHTNNQQFLAAYNDAVELYNAERLDECVDKAREILSDPSIPRYHRMRTLVLLGSTLGDWEEANNCREDAEVLWLVTRRWHRKGESEDVDEFMDDIRRQLDELSKYLAEEEPEDSDLDEAIDDDGDALDEEVADAEGMMEDLDLDQDNRIEADEPSTQSEDLDLDQDNRMKADELPAQCEVQTNT
jgi:hypothetical protein